MPLGMEVGFSPGDFVLDGDPAPVQKRGRRPQFSANVRCGQTAGRWTKMPLGVEVRLGPGDIVFDGTQLTTEKEHNPTQFFGPCVLLPKGWMDQGATWYEGKPRPRRCCDRWGRSSISKGHSPPIFGSCLFWPNGWMDEDATWYGTIDLGPGHIVLDGVPSSSAKGAQQPPSFRPMPILVTVAHLSYC